MINMTTIQDKKTTTNNIKQISCNYIRLEMCKCGQIIGDLIETQFKF